MKRKGAGQAAQVTQPYLFESEARDVATLSQWFTDQRVAEAVRIARERLGGKT